MALDNNNGFVTIFVKGAHLTRQYVITPPIGMTNGKPKERWIERRRCKAVTAHDNGVSITADLDIFTSRGIEISTFKEAASENVDTYDNDFYAWTQEQAHRLREGAFSQLDIENIAEEIESMGRSDKREIESRLVVLLAHLLKWQVQVGFRSRSWSATIREQRDRIQDLLGESPSLRPVVTSMRPALYARARRVAADETGLPETTFPAACRFTSDQILAEDFLPQD
jgi:hypothetical protein